MTTGTDATMPVMGEPRDPEPPTEPRTEGAEESAEQGPAHAVPAIELPYWVRATVNLPRLPAGSLTMIDPATIDEDDYTARALRGGLLVPAAPPGSGE